MKKTSAKSKAASRASQPRKSATKSKPAAKKASSPKRPAGGKPKTAKARSDAPVEKGKTSHEQATGKAASRLIDQRIRDLGDWRGETLAQMRALILAADPEMVEEWKWMGTPVWSHQGIVCTGESYKQVVKLTFAKGASLPDPARLFNSSLDGNTRRAIDIREGEQLDGRAFKALIKAAVAQNGAPANKANSVAKEAQPSPARKGKKGAVVLLRGGNPQIAKADGDAPVQAYLAAIPGWKHDLGQRLDALIARSVPNVCKAVKWNSPFYGIEGQGWFVTFHVFTRYVKLTFFRGTSLKPTPPGGTGKDARWIDLREGEKFDAAQLAKWLKQAAALPGWLA